jgi:hypothetical protein
VTRRISLGCALLAVLGGGCQQRLVLDDRAADASLSGTGGKNGSGGRGGGPTDASSVDAHCSPNPPTIPYQPDKPQILVALDRSSAMGASFGGMSSESELQAALDAVQTYVTKYSGGHNGSASIQFAFLAFPDPSNNCNSSNGCCVTQVTSSYSDFEAANTCSGPMQNCLLSSTRPTAAALYAALEYYNSTNGGGPQHSNENYVLLITDDDPHGSCTDGSAICSDAIAAVKALSYIGVTTEVIAIGPGAFCLTDLAQEQNVIPSPYSTVSTPQELSTQIQMLTAAVAQNSCRLTLSSPPTSDSLLVKFNGAKQNQDSGTTGDGWFYSGDYSTRLFLHGSLCNMYLQSLLQGMPTGSVGLQIYDGCPSQHPGGNP